MLCDTLQKADPANWEWQEAMLTVKKKYPKSSVRKGVFSKWHQNWLSSKGDTLLKEAIGILRQKEIIA